MNRFLFIFIFTIFISGCIQSEEDKMRENLKEKIKIENNKTLQALDYCKEIIIKKIGKSTNEITIPKYSMKSLENTKLNNVIAPFRDGYIAEFHWTGINKVILNNIDGQEIKINIICEYDIKKNKLIDFSIYSNKEDNFIPRSMNEYPTEYFLISKEKNGEYVKTVHTRLSSQNVGYSLSLIDCKKTQYQDLGYGEKGKLEIDMYDNAKWIKPIFGSSKADLIAYICER